MNRDSSLSVRGLVLALYAWVMLFAVPAHLLEGHGDAHAHHDGPVVAATCGDDCHDEGHDHGHVHDDATCVPCAVRTLAVDGPPALREPVAADRVGTPPTDAVTARFDTDGPGGLSVRGPPRS